MVSNGKHGLNAGWTLQNINLTAKLILSIVAIVLIISSVTAAWVRQEYQSAKLEGKINRTVLSVKENQQEIVVFRERQFGTEIQLVKLNAAIDRLNENLERIENKLSE